MSLAVVLLHPLLPYISGTLLSLPSTRFLHVSPLILPRILHVVHVPRYLVYISLFYYLFMSHKDPVYLAASLNSELIKLSTWFKANKLSLNLKKTNFMSFKPRQKRYHFPMQICINEQRIEQVKETVFLGVVVDEHLSWKPHISQVARKISKSIGVINRARFFLPKPCLKLFIIV